MNKKKSKERYLGFPSEKTKTRMFRKKSSQLDVMSFKVLITLEVNTLARRRPKARKKIRRWPQF